MYRFYSVCLVVPALDEAGKIALTLARVPRCIDAIVVIDDGSRDGTAGLARQVPDARVRVLEHGTNLGVGRAVATGYGFALRHGYDIAVVIGADGQMHPSDLEPLLDAVVDGADYAKGNRLTRARHWLHMPPDRLAGTLVLSTLTMLATGLYRVFDSQCGYTAIRCSLLPDLALDDLLDRYGYPNDLLVRLARAGAKVVDVPVRPIYGPGTSKMRIPQVVGPISGLLWRAIAQRLSAT